MLGNRPHTMIGRLSELLVSGNRAAGFLEASTITTSSPRSPLDFKIQSPRGLKNYDLGGVGLGIVAALEKSSTGTSDGGHEILAKRAICSPRFNRSSDPVPASKNCERVPQVEGLEEMEMEIEYLENYTYVTSHAPNQSFTKVYYDGGDEHAGRRRKRGHDDTRARDFGVVVSVPLPKQQHTARIPEEDEDGLTYPTSDFLSSCHLCRKRLDGKDIYMYRGEKAFCSAECRSRQIILDERKEQCRSEIARSAEVSSSPIFSTGILAI